MENIPCREDYTYEKFILYLYLCAAYADYVINEEEKDVIRDKMVKRKLIKAEDFDKCWNEVLHDFKKHNDIESMEHVQACCKQLNLDEVARMKIYSDFTEIIKADGREDDSERLNMYKFKKILAL